MCDVHVHHARSCVQAESGRSAESLAGREPDSPIRALILRLIPDIRVPDIADIAGADSPARGGHPGLFATTVTIGRIIGRAVGRRCGSR